MCDEPEGIIPARYVARYHWVTIEDLDAVAPDELKDPIRNSYKMFRDKLAKKLWDQIG